MTYWECVKDIFTHCWKLITVSLIIIPTIFYFSANNIIAPVAGAITIILLVLFIAHAKWDATYNNNDE